MQRGAAGGAATAAVLAGVLLAGCRGNAGEEQARATGEAVAGGAASGGAVGAVERRVDTLELRRSASQLQADLESRLPGFDSIGGRGKSGDLAFSYVAYLEDGEPVLIREHQDLGDYGHSDNEYFFADGVLTYYVQGQISRMLVPGGPPASDAIVLRLHFDGEGRLAYGERTVNGRPVPLEGYEELSVTRRSGALREAALAGGGEQPVEAAEPAAPILVEFAEGSSSVSYAGRVVAREVRSYVVAAEKGQRLSVSLESDSRYAQFMVQFAGQSVHDSRRSGERSWSDELPRDGTYTVRVYLGRGEAERGGAADYGLTIGRELAEGRRP